MLGHKDSEITRLMNLVSQRDGSLQEKDVVIADLQSRCRSIEARLAALSASCELNGPNVAAKVQADVERDSLSRSMLEAIQSLSSRLISSKKRQSHNSTNHSRGPPNRQPSSSQVLPSSFGFLTAPGRPNGPTDPDDRDGDEGDEDEEELIQDQSPTTERDIVDSRSLQHAKIDPIPTSAADYRVWQNRILFLMGRIDLSGND